MKVQGWITTTLVLMGGSAALAQQPADKTKPAATEKTAPARLDRFGDPLPAGSMARLGSVRPVDKPVQGMTNVVISSDGWSS